MILIQLVGGLLLFSAIIFYVWSFRVNRDKPEYALYLLMLGGLLLRVYTCADPSLHSWDERYHALVAKHLADSPFYPTLYLKPLLAYNYTNWTACHVWLHKQPFALWCIALSLKVFGIHTWAVRVPSIIMSTIGIKITYNIAKSFYDKNVAFIAAFLFSINGLIVELASGRTDTDHIDVIFMFFILLGVWCAIRQVASRTLLNTALVGLCMGIAVLTKWLPGIIILPLWLILSVKKFPLKNIIADSIIILGIAMAVVLPWQIYTFYCFPKEASWEMTFNGKHFFDAVEGHSGYIFFYINELRISYGELVYVPICIALISVLRKRQMRDVLFVVWFFIVYLFYTIAATKMAAYTVIAAPAVFVIIAHIYQIFRMKKQLYLRIVAYLLLLLPIRYTIERIKPLSGFYIEEAWDVGVSDLARSQRNADRTIVFNCPHAIEAMFATDHICYEQTPSSYVIKQLQNSGYTILIYK